MAHNSHPSSWILPTTFPLPKLLLVLLCQMVLAFQPTPLSYWQVSHERSWNICYEILPAWKKTQKKQLHLTLRVLCFIFFLYCPDSKWRAHWNLPKTCIPRTYHLCIWLADFHWTTHVFQPAHGSGIQHTEQSAFSVTNLPSRSWHHRGEARKQAPGSSKTLQTSWSRGNLAYSIVQHCLIKNPLLLPAPILLQLLHVAKGIKEVAPKDRQVSSSKNMKCF